MSNPEMTLNEKTKSMKQEAVLLDYKQTEVGIIPKDWIVLDIAKTMKLINGYGFKPSQWEKEGLPIIRIQNLNDANAPYNYFPGVIDTKFHVKNGDLLFAWSGSKGVSFGARVWQGKKAILNQHIFKIIPNENFITANYSYYVLRKVQEQIEKMAHGFKSSFVHVKKGDLENTPLPIPPKKEQTAIANVLSDTDALITELEKLIAKKQAIKTATMQQLLAGRTRLPQFAKHPDGTTKGYKTSEVGQIPEDWNTVSIYELADKQKAKFDDGDWIESEHITDKGIRLIQTGNIGVGQFLDKESKKYISETSFEQLRCKELQIGDLLICRLAEPAGRACIFTDISESKVITSVDVTIFRPDNNRANRQFLSQYFSSLEWFKNVHEQVGGTTHKRISRGALGKIIVPCPTVKEQTAIATILSDMDAELEALEQKLAKFRDIKQGMMQQLLTGRIRLPLAHQP